MAVTTQATTTFWAVLGIAATDDRAAIRRAYSTRLKVVQPEDDPEGFKQLRAAYEQAMALAERALAIAARAAAEAATPEPPPPEPPPPEPPRATEPEPAAAAATAAAPDPRQSVVGRPAYQAAHEAACNRLGALLTGQGAPPVDEIGAALRAVLTSPALDEVSTHLQTESWLARLICHAVPRSDVIVEPVASAFGWKPDALYVADPAVAGAIGRLSALQNSRLLGQLDAMLRGPAEPEENKLFGVLDKVTTPAVIRHPQQGPQIEAALAKLLLEARPRSDVLIPVVTRRLGWGAPAREASADPAIVEAAKLAAQMAPRVAPAVRRTSRRVDTAGNLLRAILGLFLVLGLVSYCATQLSKLQSGAPETPIAGQPQPASSPVTYVFSKRGIDVTVASEAPGSAEVECSVSGGLLQDCTVQRASDPRLGAAAFKSVEGLPLPERTEQRPPEASRLPIHVRFIQQAPAPPEPTARSIDSGSAPEARLSKDGIDMEVRSSENGSAELSCVAGDGRLRDCVVVQATSPSKAQAARFFALRLVLPQQGATAPAVGARLPVRITFHGV